MFARSVRQVLVGRSSALASCSRGGLVRTASHFARSSAPALSSLSNEGWNNMTAAAAAVALATATVVTTTFTHCHENTPSAVAEEDLEQVTSLHEMDNLPVYSSDQVAQHNGDDGTRIWMTYGGVVYDVTDFIPNHPGGSEQILKASGSVSKDEVNDV